MDSFINFILIISKINLFWIIFHIFSVFKYWFYLKDLAAGTTEFNNKIIHTDLLISEIEFNNGVDFIEENLIASKIKSQPIHQSRLERAKRAVTTTLSSTKTSEEAGSGSPDYTTDQSTTDQSTTDQSTTDQSKTFQSTTFQSTTGQNTTVMPSNKTEMSTNTTKSITIESTTIEVTTTPINNLTTTIIFENTTIAINSTTNSMAVVATAAGLAAGAAAAAAAAVAVGVVGKNTEASPWSK